MWPIPILEHKLVSVSFSPDFLECSWIEQTSARTAPLVLRAYKQFPLTNFELAHGVLFNPTAIKRHIQSFLYEHDLADAFIAFIVQGSALVERLVAMPTSTPSRAAFDMATNARSTLWEYRYLYPNDHGQFVFYLYSIPRSVVLQYELLAISAQCNLITMTTKTMSLLSAYQYIFGNAFRRSQLAVDMMKCNNKIADLITADGVKSMVSGAVGYDIVSCAAAAGLFYSERVR